MLSLIVLLNFTPAIAMTTEEFGVEIAHLVMNVPRATSRSLNELIDEVNGWPNLQMPGIKNTFSTFLKGFGPSGTPRAVVHARIDALVAELDLSHPGNRWFNIGFAIDAAGGAFYGRRYLVRLSRRLTNTKTFSSYGLLPMIDAMIASHKFTLHPVDGLFPREVEEAHDRLLTYLARQARGDARTVLVAE